MRTSRFATRALIAAGALAATALPSSAASHGQGFPWPVKPFFRQHPIRANFGDPRTVFLGKLGRSSIMSSGGHFSFHSGVDIVAKTGQPVYPVRSGTVRIVSPVEVAVDSPDGTSFVYWHIRPAVSNGEPAVALQTILGRVRKEAGHVHLGEFENGAFVNPLASGHLTPYRDRIAPRVTAITIRQAGTGALLDPVWVHGRIKISADAFDLPALKVPGEWAGLPVAPAVVTWRLLEWKGKVAIPDTVAADFRGALPPRSDFWDVYARGTYQNMTSFRKHLAFLQPGRYVFNLTPQPLDTRHLRYGNDVYELVVTAVDIRGNASTLTQRITIQNASRKPVRARP
jgi:hypothetical protein